MMKGALVVLLASLVATSGQLSEDQDPVCFSKYDYDVKMLGKMLSIENIFEKESKRIENQITVSDEKLSQFQTTVDNSKQAMEARLEELERTSKQQIQDFMDQKTRQVEERLTAIDQNVGNRFQALTERNSDTLTGFETLKTTLVEVITKANQTPVAFVATGIRNPSLQRGEKLKFTEVRLNIGENFDESTSMFTAPQSGIYLFTAQVNVKYLYSYGITIFANDNDIGRTSGVMNNVQNYWSAIAVGVALLDAGTDVKVMCSYRYPASGAALISSTAFGETSFKGVLIRAL